MIRSENRFTLRIECTAGLFGIMRAAAPASP
jgi:hypothetical protein